MDMQFHLPCSFNRRNLSPSGDAQELSYVVLAESTCTKFRNFLYLFGVCGVWANYKCAVEGWVRWLQIDTWSMHSNIFWYRYISSVRDGQPRLLLRTLISWVYHLCHLWWCLPLSHVARCCYGLEPICSGLDGPGINYQSQLVILELSSIQLSST